MEATSYESAEYALLAEIDGQDLDGLVFCAKAYALFEAVRTGPEGITRLRMLRGKLVKRLIGEVLPMCRYIQEHYRAGRYIAVKWSSGSQSFDAVLTQRGSVAEAYHVPAVSHVEVTEAMHPNEYLSREAIEQDGFVFGLDGLKRIYVDGKPAVESVAVAYSINQQVEQFAGFLLEAIQKKTTKVPAYPPASTLVVSCHLNSLYMADEWETLMDSVRRKIEFGPFIEIYVFDSITHMDRLFRQSWIGGEAM
jgi:hypothetical protein